MNKICRFGKYAHVSYSIVEIEEGYQAEIDNKTNNILKQQFIDFYTAECWIKKIINDNTSEMNEIERYS